MGLQARLMSQALRKLTSMISKTNTSVIFINQVRMKIGTFYGNPETTPGGTALKFYSSVRLEIRRVETLKKGEDAYGNRVKVKVVKNKVAPPFKVAEFDILFTQGISKMGCIIDAAITKGIIKKSGTWFSYGEEKLGQGKENVRKILDENATLAKKIEDDVRKALNEPDVEPLVSSSDEKSTELPSSKESDFSEDVEENSSEEMEQDSPATKKVTKPASKSSKK